MSNNTVTYTYNEIRDDIIKSYNNGLINQTLVKMIMNGKENVNINLVIDEIYKRVKRMFDYREDRFDISEIDINNECIIVDVNNNQCIRSIHEMVNISIFVLE